jgi:hypothetical protein
VAVVVLGRAARAGGSSPGDGAGGGEEGVTSAGSGWSFDLGLVDWMCADTCASICRNRCVVACTDAKDPSCVTACYPVCADDCYFDCLRPRAKEPQLFDFGLEVGSVRLMTDVDGGAP